MEFHEIFLDTYVLQQDMRMRIPKAVLYNMGAEKGVSKFDFFYRPEDDSLVLRIHREDEGRVKYEE